MLTKYEQRLLLKMFKESRYEKKLFFREELLRLGIFNSEKGLSIATRNLYFHFFVDIIHREKPDMLPRERLQQMAESRVFGDGTFTGKTIMEYNKREYKRREKEIDRIVTERIKNITRMIRGYKRDEPRLRYELTEEGSIFARILEKAELWKREIERQKGYRYGKKLNN
jgi:hypothetical protein